MKKNLAAILRFQVERLTRQFEKRAYQYRKWSDELRAIRTVYQCLQGINGQDQILQFIDEEIQDLGNLKKHCQVQIKFLEEAKLNLIASSWFSGYLREAKANEAKSGGMQPGGELALLKAPEQGKSAYNLQKGDVNV